MARVLTFSRTFPAYHPKAGQPTYFVEKIATSLYDTYPIGIDDQFYNNLGRIASSDWPKETLRSFLQREHIPKHHTIRAEKRWKVGDKFSPRVWSGKPYNSPQIVFAPDIEVKKTWGLDIVRNRLFINRKRHCHYLKMEKEKLIQEINEKLNNVYAQFNGTGKAFQLKAAEIAAEYIIDRSHFPEVEEAVHLNANRNISKDTAEALMAMIKLARKAGKETDCEAGFKKKIVEIVRQSEEDVIIMMLPPEDLYDIVADRISNVILSLLSSKEEEIAFIKEYMTKQIDELAELIDDRDKKIADLKALLSEAPKRNTTLPAAVQRLWESCNTLVEKAAFKHVFRHMEDQESEIKRLKEEGDYLEARLQGTEMRVDITKKAARRWADKAIASLPSDKVKEALLTAYKGTESSIMRAWIKGIATDLNITLD